MPKSIHIPKLSATPTKEPLSLLIKDTNFPAPFTTHLEFNAPVRGPWNIVHKALLLPEAHLIYICARGCLRGVIMTVHEMGAANRFSWVGVSEEDIALGSLEEKTYQSVSHILDNLNKKPPLVLLYLSCIHKFMHFDYQTLLNLLNQRYPQITFVDCYMMPTMRKSGPTDEERTYVKMYQALYTRKNDNNVNLEENTLEEKSINFIGNDQPIKPQSLILELLQKEHFIIRDLNFCQTYCDYLDLAKSKYNLTIFEDAYLAAETLSQNLNQTHIHLPVAYTPAKIRDELNELAQILEFKLDTDLINLAELKACASMQKAKGILGNMPIHIDYTFSPKPLNLARALLDFGFNVQAIYLDAFDPKEEDDYIWLKTQAPNLLISATLAPEERFKALSLNLSKQNDPVLALGQKAAYLTQTNYFVNLVRGGGLYDFKGLSILANLMVQASFNPKPLGLILAKGLNCPSLLSNEVLEKLSAKNTPISEMPKTSAANKNKLIYPQRLDQVVREDVWEG
ncbi:MAG: hypothetical protein IJT59_04750 [Desulfovibrionaceae bacterium]|nr:hypothetical protein [Desulfovibrionaceae bacterium]